MQEGKLVTAPARKDGKIIIHFDYDCFYASVVEHEDPALKQCCLAIQQKQIIVTCNYEARRRGLHKLQLISEAKKLCPDVVIVLGEDLTRFRNASKELYQYLKQFSWNGKVERLGFDEVWADVTDLVEYNHSILNRNTLQTSFFQLSKEDPTQGFHFDATVYAGHTYPGANVDTTINPTDHELALRLRLGSHLAMYMRHKLDDEKGYTCTVGISTSKLLSKLVGNLHKPCGQTTIVPPYSSTDGIQSTVTTFIDDYEIGQIPGIGFKLAQKLREYVLLRPATFDKGLIYGGRPEAVKVRAVRSQVDCSPDRLEKLLGGPGSPQGIGLRVWQLLHGVDDTKVALARQVPRQISIEDSYIRLDTLPELLEELTTLSRSLITRMRIDLLGDNDDDEPPEVSETVDEKSSKEGGLTNKRWLAHPRTIRLSTRPRMPLNADGTRTRSFKRISHSAPLPNFVLSITASIDALVEKLVQETLVPMFRKLHPEKAGWNLSLVNVAVTNMAETAGESKTASGRDIGNMFRKQDDVLKDFRVVDEGSLTPGSDHEEQKASVNQESRLAEVEVEVEDRGALEEDDDEGQWEDGTVGDDIESRCGECGAMVPSFAFAAHSRYHALGD